MQCTNEDPRTSRAGQYELQHWRHMRYCQNHQLFRVLHGRADQNYNLTACEENVRIRFEDCNTTRCLPCNPHCTQNWLETVDAVVKCGSPYGNLAALYCEMNTDQGRFLQNSGGGVPETIFKQHYQTCVHNPKGYVAREAISCRRPDRHKPAVSIADPEERVYGGYMVPCITDADCQETCPPHWLSQTHYACMKPYKLYDRFVVPKNGAPYFHDDTDVFGVPLNSHFDPPTSGPLSVDADGMPYTGV